MTSPDATSRVPFIQMAVHLMLHFTMEKHFEKKKNSSSKLKSVRIMLRMHWNYILAKTVKSYNLPQYA